MSTDADQRVDLDALGPKTTPPRRSVLEQSIDACVAWGALPWWRRLFRRPPAGWHCRGEWNIR